MSLLNANAVLGGCCFGVGGVKASGPSGVDGGVVKGLHNVLWWWVVMGQGEDEMEC